MLFNIHFKVSWNEHIGNMTVDVDEGLIGLIW